MHGSTAVFTVKNVMESLAYYRDKLGFDVAFEYGKPTFYIGLCSGEVTVQPPPRRRANPATAPSRSSSTTATRSMPIW